MPNSLNLAAMFKSDADDLKKAREKARHIHRADIRAAGNEVEQAVRDYLKRMLPPRYYVTHGHLIDPEHRVSPQLDVIIADNFNLPSLATTKDGTEYIPVTSVLAIGEIKSTYYRSQKYYQKFHDTLSIILSELSRPLIENTFYEGLKDHATIADIVRGSSRKYLNNLYSFLLCINSGDFDFSKIKNLLTSANPELLPTMTVFLDKGIVTYAKLNEKGVAFHKYPIEVKGADYDWCFAQGSKAEEGSLEGTHLAALYGQLISHLSDSHLEPPNAYSYTAKMSAFRKSSLTWAKGEIEARGRTVPTPESQPE